MEERKQKRLRFGLAICLLILSMMFGTCLVSAAANRNKWVKSGGYTYYLNSKGNYAKGFVKIKNRKYYFDSNAVQRTGWRNIRGAYYYFRLVNGSGGYMMRNITIDGIKILSNGKAKVTSANKRKLGIMTYCQGLLDQYTVPSWSMAQKLRTMFDYVCWNFGNSWIPDYFYEKDYDAVYAEFLFYRGYGDCFAFACGFGYLMNAIGYHNVVVAHNTKHCWIEWNKHTFDPHWHMSYPSTNTYYISRAQNGTGGRPDLISISQYHKNIEKP